VTVLGQDVGVLEQGLQVDVAIVVDFKKELDGVRRCRVHERRHELEHEHGLEGEVVVGVDEALLQDVAVHIALSLKLTLKG